MDAVIHQSQPSAVHKATYEQVLVVTDTTMTEETSDNITRSFAEGDGKDQAPFPTSVSLLLTPPTHINPPG